MRASPRRSLGRGPFDRGGVWCQSFGPFDRDNQSLNRRFVRIVGDDRFVVLERHRRACDPFDSQQCGPH